MADVINISPVFDTQNPARLAAQLRTFATQVQQVARKVSYEGAIYVWDEGCRGIPTNTDEDGATEFVFKSGYPGDGTVILTVIGAEGGVTASLNGVSLGTMSNVDTSSEIEYEFYVDNLVATDNPLNSLKVWSTTGDSAEVRRVEIWRNHVKAAIDAVTELAEDTATNFNGRNDRDGSAVTVPVVADDGTAIDHVLNTDSTATISFEWTWGGDEEDIDGFVIYVRESTSSASYTIGDTPAEETPYYAPADKRAFFLQGVPANKYYTFGIAAYRIVDPDIDAAGIIYSMIAQPSLASEDPYRPSSNVAFQGDITGTINGTAASAVSSAVTNFNSRNDRDDTAVTDPTIASDGTAIDHTVNDDGSVDISFEWSWGGTEADIDGFIIYLRNSSSSSSYNFGTTPSTETVQYVSAEKRVVFLFGVPANRYYTFGVQAYRVVDPDVDSSGILKSGIVQCTRTEEDPYRPSASVAFNGDVTGTIDGTAAGDVNKWSAIQDDDGTRPENNATRNTNTDNLIRNPGAEEDTLSPHVASDGGGSWVVGTTARSGAKSFTYLVAGQNADAALDLNGPIGNLATAISCRPGDEFYIEAYAVRGTSGTTANRMRVGFVWLGAGGAVAASVYSSGLNPTGTFQKISLSATAPSNAIAVVPRLNVLNDGGDYNLVFDDVYCIQKRDASNALVPGSITTVTIGDDQITAPKISVNELSAISATIGLLRTAASGARTEIEDNQIRVYDSSNNLRVRMGIW